LTAIIKLSLPEIGGSWELPILYQDEHLLALDKPAGVGLANDLTAPEPGLVGLLRAGIAQRKAWAAEHALQYLANPYRLEPGASGVLLLARRKDVLISLNNLFGGKEPLLTWIALAQGRPAEPEFAVETPLAPDPRRPGLLRADPKRGKRARTRFSVVEQFSGWTLLKCRPIPPRPYQVSAHLRSIRLPVVGDPAYGGKPLLLSQLKSGYRLKQGRVERPLIPGPALHVAQVALPHPVSGESLNIEAPLPKDFAVALKYLRRYNSG
jgi:23S rRNA-/tRNA-specific pseudouridylate synthase